MDGAGSDALADTTEFGARFAVGALPGLILWLDATKGITLGGDGGASVQMWKDQSALGNDLAPFDDRQTNVCTLNPGAVHGHDAVNCANFGLQNNTPHGFDLGTDSFLVAAVMLVAGSHNGFAAQGTNTMGLLTTGLGDSSPSAAIFSGGPQDLVTGPMKPPGAHLVAGLRKGGTLSLRVDGVQVGVETNFDASRAFTSTRIEVGAFHGTVAEVVVIHGEPSADDLTSLEGYFKSRYGL